MTFNEYVQNAIRTAKQGDFAFDVMHAAMGIAGESGEFTDCVKKHLIYDQPLDIENAAEELGDLLWYIAIGCNAIGITMEQIAIQNITKLKKRYPEKYSDFHASARLDKSEMDAN